MSTRDAATQYVNASDGMRFAYRRFGTPSRSGIPVLFHKYVQASWHHRTSRILTAFYSALSHFRGNMDWWDPLLVDTIAAKREVILLDGAGVGKTSGVVQDNFQGWADDAVAFADALGLEKADLFGYSMGARTGRSNQSCLFHRGSFTQEYVSTTSGSHEAIADPKDGFGWSFARNVDSRFIQGCSRPKVPDGCMYGRISLLPAEDIC